MQKVIGQSLAMRCVHHKNHGIQIITFIVCIFMLQARKWLDAWQIDPSFSLCRCRCAVILIRSCVEILGRGAVCAQQLGGFPIGYRHSHHNSVYRPWQCACPPHTTIHTHTLALIPSLYSACTNHGCLLTRSFSKHRLVFRLACAAW